MFIFLKIISFIFSLAPRTFIIRIGKLLGWVIWKFYPHRKETALLNLDIAFKNLSKSDKEIIVKNCYIHFSIILMDFIISRSLNKYKLDKILSFPSESIELLNSSSGGIIMSGHLGNWEMLLPGLGLNGFNFNVVTQTQKNNSINNYFNWARTHLNITLIPRGGKKIKRMYKALNNKEFLGLASDQNARSKGVKIDFFGKKSSFPKGAGIFYNRIQCDVFMVLCIMNNKYKYDIIVEKLNVEKNNKSEEDIIIGINKLYIKILTDKIKKYPEQYFWFHKKWNKKIYK